MRHRALALLALATPASLLAQEPLRSYDEAFELRRGASEPALAYTVRWEADYPYYEVTLRVRQSGDTVRVRMPVWAPGAYRLAHFARNVRDLSVRIGDRSFPVVREDSSTWRAVVPGGHNVVVRYVVELPHLRTAWMTPNNRSFLRGDGALFDGPQTFVYLDGHTLAPAHVRFELPAGWRIATGLVPTGDPAVFTAPSYDVLIDSPVLAGPRLHVWTFAVHDVPHRVVYWSDGYSAPFDTVAFTESVKQVVEGARGVMRRLPYRDYTFLFVDGAGGGLEHLNSTTVGARSRLLAADPRARAMVTAHEFFHLWNVKRVRPLALGPFDYQHEVRTTELWWSEGVTDFFAAEIVRRSHGDNDSLARANLAETVQEYLGNPAHTRMSPERASWTAWDTPAVNGGYSISYYTQGALFGELLDIELRRRALGGMDDVMRLLFTRFAGAHGFVVADLERAVNEVCGCDMHPFFAQHVRSASPLDVNQWLPLIGYRAVVTRGTALDSLGHPSPDLRLTVLPHAGFGSAGGDDASPLRIVVSDPGSAWGRAGLITGDELVRIGARTIGIPSDGQDVRRALDQLRIGDVVTVDVVRDGVPKRVTVAIAGYDRTTVTLVDLPSTQPIRNMRDSWLRGPPDYTERLTRVLY